MDILTKIHGIGPELAKKLLAILDIKKPILPQLLRKDIFLTLPVATRAHLTYKPKTAVSRALLLSTVKKLEKRGAIIAGSYRRQLNTINDLDVLITDYKLIADIFTEPYACGKEVVHTFCRIKSKQEDFYINVDIFIYKDLAPYLLYATGSQRFNIIMRNVAKKKGMLLNQHGLFKNNKKIICKTELDIFSALDLKYVEPHLR